MEIIYWVIVTVWIIVILILKKKAGFSMKIALAFFAAAAVLTVLTLRNLAEPLMRVSLIGWLVGVFQAVWEYVRSSEDPP